MSDVEPCRILNLPAEQRNTIWAFALSIDRGLTYLYDGSVDRFYENRPAEATPMHDLSAHEANQLKYVCRQLHQETSGLSIRYNDIYFNRIMDARAFLVDRACERDLAHLRRIQVIKHRYSDVSERTDGIEALKRWCFGHPLTTIHLRHATLDVNSGWFFFNAMFIQFRYRAKCEIAQVIVPDPHKRADMMVIFENMARTKSIDLSKSAATTPPNIVFCPGNEIFDEEAFRRAVHNNGVMPGLLPSGAEKGSLDRCVRLAKDIHENGI